MQYRAMRGMPAIFRTRDVGGLRAALLLPAMVLIASGQSVSAPAQLSLTAEVVLTPEFCATKSKKGSFFSGAETFKIGEVACPEIERALKKSFSSVTRVAADPVPGASGAQVVLVPKFTDTSATKAVIPTSSRELVIFLEWTAKDAMGKPVWIETVQGSAKKAQGGGGVPGIGSVSIAGGIWGSMNRKHMVRDAVKDLAETSARKLAESPELRKLAR